MAEQHFREAHAEHNQPSHQPAAQGLEGYRFDMDECRRMFKSLDKDSSGYLDIEELTRLAELLWNKFHPHGPRLTEARKKVRF